MAPRPNAKEYISACCNVPARKPKAGQQEVSKDPESGKMKSAPKGLGKWRCGACGKVAKVSPRKPEGNMASLSCPDVIYPAKLHTPAIVEIDMAKVEQRVIASIPLAPPNVHVEVTS